MSSKIERMVSGRKYVYRVDQTGTSEFYDETDYRTKYQSDLSSYLPPATPKLTKKGKVAVHQPRFIQMNLKWWKAQCNFRGLPLSGTTASLQARIRSQGDAGLAPAIKEVYESMGKEFLDTRYENRSNDDKAKLFPKRFLRETFETQSPRREDIIVVEVEGRGEPIEKAARELSLICEVRKMPGYQQGQRRAVVGLDALKVRAKMAEFDMEAQRATERARREAKEKKEKAENDFQQSKLAKAKDSQNKGQ